MRAHTHTHTHTQEIPRLGGLGDCGLGDCGLGDCIAATNGVSPLKLFLRKVRNRINAMF